MSRNAHVFIDGVDQTTPLGGPWDGGGAEFEINELDISAYITSGGFH
jgi:hypothetical protein